ncbi:MAG TPA: sugar ABC transporter ATP-binding protein [Oligoflexus sp.]|uniref:sugar ABC transporter ATP-binding protein n=1 Tax=Oligoflexus sp. TaxID=1971216 RepID=UPI002D7F9D19|nr:sugar ABC transporter ATP-binding protein [Oligoflexus sp.]HET9241642.1 sugar ABC transporter ATP-binding protein [Oligoflexus sp.]
MSGFVLEMKGITKLFPGVKSLDDVSLNVKPGSVHALMGENGAGKSTLMKCLFGLYQPDRGTIVFDGKAVQIKEPKQALERGIAMIHQELHPVPDRSVMENVWLGRFPVRRLGPFSWVSDRSMEEATTKLFQELDISMDPRVRIGTLSVSKIQLIEIAKAVSYQSKIIIMDEPTSSLTGPEAERLFAIIRDLKKRGVAIIYISHKMEEILRIADEVTILRDGRKVGTWPASELTIDTMIHSMVGRSLDQRFPPKLNIPNETYFEVKNLSAGANGRLRDVSFSVKKGEILGIGGLVGAQRTELLETIFGLRPKATGQFFSQGKEIFIRSPRDAIQHGLALLTEERRVTGIFPTWSVLENTVIANQKHYRGPFGLIRDKPRIADTERSIHDLRIKTPSWTAAIKNLSGGNQQKVLLARWLLTQPTLLLLDEPTRGIDVGAKAEIYGMIVELAKQGKSVIVISSEMAELIGLSDRILVMCEGRVAGMIPGQGATEEQILRLATQFKEPV